MPRLGGILRSMNYETRNDVCRSTREGYEAMWRVQRRPTSQNAMRSEGSRVLGTFRTRARFVSVLPLTRWFRSWVGVWVNRA